MLSLDEAKTVAMVSLGVGSFVVGTIPVCFSKTGRKKWPLLLSALLCFGGGVLLATALIHMLPEVRERLPDLAEVLFCVGFFFVYLVDEVVHYVWGESIEHGHGTNPENHVGHNAKLSLSAKYRNVGESSRNNLNSLYGSTENDQLLMARDHRYKQPSYNPAFVPAVVQHPVENGGPTVTDCCGGETSNARICHVTHTEPCNNNSTGRAGLLIALSLHSLLEGLAIGLQESTAKVLLLVGAVASHKLVVGFCLGVELSANAPNKVCNTVLAILIFSLGSVAGIGIGMTIADQSEAMTKIALPVLQALAGGTLLYVTVCEVLPRERSRWHQSRTHRSAGLLQFTSVAIGFSSMALLNHYLGD